jgi:hypothetical protein
MRKLTSAEIEFAKDAMENCTLSGRQNWALNKVLDVAEYPNEAEPLTKEAWLILDRMRNGIG